MPRNNERVFKKRKLFGIHAKNETNQEACVDKGIDESASKLKIQQNLNDYECYMSDSCNEILDINLFSDILNASVKCKGCNNNSIRITFSRKIQGLASELLIFCEKCDFSRKFLNTKYSLKNYNNKDIKIYEVNSRLAYAMRSIGKGKAAAEMFCGVMNLPTPPSRFDDNELSSAVKKIAIKSMSDAAKEAEEIKGSKDISVAIDGTWQRRGHVSLNGVVIATSVDSRKVIDAEVMSRYCRCSNKRKHELSCQANFSGNSGAMEVQGAVTIYKRSEELHKLRYINFLGDGDSRAYKAVCEAKPYGDDTTIEKLECVGHTEKRMGTRLRALKQSYKGKKLDDNKPLGGRGRLTDKEIDRLQLYYGMAIRNNTNNLKEMQQAVWATFFHKFSTDDNPQHGLCPQTENTWCLYNKALLSGKEYKHKSSLPPEVMLKIKKVYQDLAKPELLRKCLHGKTQNNNESFNSLLWSRVPKNIFVQLDTLKTGTFEAVACYNDGNITKCKVLEELGVKPGLYTAQAMMRADRVRIRKAEYDMKQKTMEARKLRRSLKCAQEEDLADDPNDPSYGAGMH